MKDFFELFESLNEWVYVADMDSYELIFMNEYLRKVYGFLNHEEYRGKKCYSVLQGKTQPCVFCTNDRLCVGRFHEWTFMNPILNKTLLLKDTMYEEDGRRYRLELAIDSTPETKNDAKESLMAYGDSMIDDCVRKIFLVHDPNEAIELMLSFMGESFECERAYIFEFEEGEMFSNTYEWCAEGVLPQKDLLRHEPIETIDYWLHLFEQGKPVIIKNIEDIRIIYPQVYAALKPQNIDSLVAVSLYAGGKVCGFLGVDNPSKQKFDVITHVFFVIGHFISSIIERRDLLNHLEYMSYHDQLTGAYNRHAFREAVETLSDQDAAGIVYCDISGLKKVNDNMGHEAGDAMIVHFYRCLRRYFSLKEVFRTGGDEFVVICPKISETDFETRVSGLKEEIAKDEYHLSVGKAWNAQRSGGVHFLLKQAEEEMYRDKYRYYEKKKLKKERDDKGCRHENYEMLFREPPKEGGIYQFIRNNYFDVDTLFRSVTAEDAPYYLYFGDLQTNLFYISDNMKERFAFKSNVVFDLISIWENKINNREELELYRRDFENILTEKKDRHDLRYRVRDRDGNHIWVRCCGLLKWNEDRSVPLFFSGFISYQERDFIVDPVTNFPREHAASMKITEMQEKGKQVIVIGFTLNNFAEINELRGRHNANFLLQNIAQRLVRNFGENLSFYRLDGLRFMAILSSACECGIEEMIAQIREIVTTLYRNNGITVRVPCSVGVFFEESAAMSPQEVIVSVTNLLSEAKQSTDQEYVIHSPQTIQIQKDHAQMVMALSQSVLNDFEGFRIVVQPVVSAEDERIIYGEVLLRWRFKNVDISPFVFIPILEKNRLILPLGKWIFENVVRSCKRMITYDPNFKLAFNVSYYQILDKGFFPFMKQILEKYDLKGKYLVMELTETHFDDSPEQLDAFIANCKEIGISVALDDFGNGYSSLGLLLKYPATIVKLDKSLLNSMTTSEDNINFISSIVYACHKFGKSVCAEGVETSDEVRIVKGTGCDMIQGYYYYRPMELKELYMTLSKRKLQK